MSDFFRVISTQLEKQNIDATVFTAIVVVILLAVVALTIVIVKLLSSEKPKTKKISKQPAKAKKTGPKNQQRGDVRFDVLPGYPVNVFLYSDKQKISIMGDCIDFSSGGVLIELAKPETSAMEHLSKKYQLSRKLRLDKKKAEELKFQEIHAQPPLEEEEMMQLREDMLHKPEWEETKIAAISFSNHLGIGDKVEIFIMFPELPVEEGDDKAPISVENRTVYSRGVVKFIKTDKTKEKKLYAIKFVNLRLNMQDNIYQYGTELWRAKKSQRDNPRASLVE